MGVDASVAECGEICFAREKWPPARKSDVGWRGKVKFPLTVSSTSLSHFRYRLPPRSKSTFSRRNTLRGTCTRAPASARLMLEYWGLGEVSMGIQDS